MAKGGAKSRWQQRQARDAYVHSAAREGYRSRASYKLLELDRRDRLLRPGLQVLELGAAPGGWSQVAAQRIGAGGKVIAVDLLPMQPIDGVVAIQGDLEHAEVQRQVEAVLGESRADLLLSDVAPNISGVALRDQAAAAELALLGLQIALKHLRTGGVAVVKGFQGEDFPAVKTAYATHFDRLRIRKPAASRAESRECYLVAHGFRSQ